MTDQSTNDTNHALGQLLKQLQTEALHIRQIPRSHLVAVIAIDSTQLGPALGGCRLAHYPSLEEGIIDAMRLAHGMSYKAAVHNLPYGGGKAVILKPPETFDRTNLFTAFGEVVGSLNGEFITAEDSGTNVDDMDVIHQMTPYVTGHSQQRFTNKNPAPITAFGIKQGMKAALDFHLKHKSIGQCKIAIKGVGQVGYHLAKLCHEEGAQLIVCDHHAELTQQCVTDFNAEVTTPDNIHRVPCDIFAPCALSNPIKLENVFEIQAKIIAGSANNQLMQPELAEILHDRDILYAPDYVINAGGLIYVTAQYRDLNEKEALHEVENIYRTLTMIFEAAQAANTSPLAIANDIASQRLNR